MAFSAIPAILNFVSIMHAVLHTIQIVSALVLIALVLMQRTTGDMGGSAFGDASFFQSRRGSERFFFVFTIVVSALFAFSSIGVLVFA